MTCNPLCCRGTPADDTLSWLAFLCPVACHSIMLQCVELPAAAASAAAMVSNQRRERCLAVLTLSLGSAALCCKQLLLGVGCCYGLWDLGQPPFSGGALAGVWVWAAQGVCATYSVYRLMLRNAGGVLIQRLNCWAALSSPAALHCMHGSNPRQCHAVECLQYSSVLALRACAFMPVVYRCCCFSLRPALIGDVKQL